MTTDDQTKRLLLEVAGFLTLLLTQIPIPNLREQVSELLEKIGEALSK